MLLLPNDVRAFPEVRRFLESGRHRVVSPIVEPVNPVDRDYERVRRFQVPSLRVAMMRVLTRVDDSDRWHWGFAVETLRSIELRLPPAPTSLPTDRGRTRSLDLGLRLSEAADATLRTRQDPQLRRGYFLTTPEPPELLDAMRRFVQPVFEPTRCSANETQFGPQATEAGNRQELRSDRH